MLVKGAIGSVVGIQPQKRRGTGRFQIGYYLATDI